MIKKNTTKSLDFAALTKAADCLKVLAHPGRLQIVQLLLSGNRYSVGQLANCCELSQPATSDHLRLMQRCGFLKSEREGRTVYYVIAESHLRGLMACIQGRFGQEVKRN